MVHKAFSQISSTGKMKLFKSNCSDYKDGEQMRDFIYVKDVACMTIFVYEHPEVSGIINIGTGKARSFNDLAAAVFDSMDRKTNIEYFDIPDVLKLQYQNFTQADVNKVRKLGYQEEISSLEEGISDYVKSYLLKPDPYL
jgi:ADP-L-glycero-D-manno-heptose 6-epimerase